MSDERPTGDGAGGAGSHGEGTERVRGLDDDAKRRAAMEAARAAHAPRSTVSKKVAGIAYGVIVGSVVLVTVAGYLISGANGAIFAFLISLGAVVVGGVPIWLANRSQAKEREQYAAQARRRAAKRDESAVEPTRDA